MTRKLVTGKIGTPPPGYGLPRETKPPQSPLRPILVPDLDPYIMVDFPTQTTSTGSAMSADSSGDENVSVCTTTERTPTWDGTYHECVTPETGLEGYENIPVSNDGSNTPEEFKTLSEISPYIPPEYPRGGLRRRPDGLNIHVDDDDPSEDYSEKLRQAPNRKRKSTKQVAKEDLDDETEDDDISFQAAGDDDTSNEDEEEETGHRFSTFSASDTIKARQLQLPVRSKYATTARGRSKSESPYAESSTCKHRSKKSSKKSKKSKKRLKRSKSKSKSKRPKKSQKRRQSSPTPSISSTASSDSIRSITPPRNTITTKFCHPIAFNHEDATTPCSLCDIEFAFLGHGPRTVEVHDRGHDAGLEEVTPSNLPITKVCVPCTATRMRVLVCKKHILQPIEDNSITSTQFGDAFQRVLNKQPLQTDVWCSVCPAPALYKCVGSGVLQGEPGCGLVLCELCAVGLHEGAKGVLDTFLGGLGEGGEERPLGVRADAELLRLNGALAGFMIRMAGEDWDE